MTDRPNDRENPTVSVEDISGFKQQQNESAGGEGWGEHRKWKQKVREKGGVPAFLVILVSSLHCSWKRGRTVEGEGRVPIRIALAVFFENRPQKS